MVQCQKQPTICLLLVSFFCTGPSNKRFRSVAPQSPLGLLHPFSASGKHHAGELGTTMIRSASATDTDTSVLNVQAEGMGGSVCEVLVLQARGPIPSTHVQITGIVAQPGAPGLGVQRQKGPWGLMGSQAGH